MGHSGECFTDLHQFLDFFSHGSPRFSRPLVPTCRILTGPQL
jgi:hypothetical protein